MVIFSDLVGNGEVKKLLWDSPASVMVDTHHPCHCIVLCRVNRLEPHPSLKYIVDIVPCSLGKMMSVFFVGFCLFLSGFLHRHCEKISITSDLL